MKKSKWLLFILFLVVASVIYFFYKSAPARVPKARHAAKPSTVLTVETAKAQESIIPKTVAATGHVVAPQTIMLTAKQAGTLEGVYFKMGDFVKRGQLLAKVDDTLQMAELRSAQADYYAKLKMYRRYINASAGAITKNDMNTLVAQYKAAKALVDSKQKQVNDTEIRAPFSGYIGAMQQIANSTGDTTVYTQINNGAYLNIGTPIATLTNAKRLQVRYDLPQSLSAELKVGQSVKVSSSAYPKRYFTGKVSYISSLVNEASQTVNVSAVMSERSRRLMSGMRVFVTQVLDPNRKVIAIPGLSLIPSIQGYSVYTVVKGKVMQLPVQVGQRYQGKVEIVSGLKQGQPYITKGVNTVHPGASVKVVAK